MPKRFRGVPPPPTFSLSALPDDAVLLPYEVSQVRRESTSHTERGRLLGTDGLTWVYLQKRPRCVAGSLKKVMAGSDERHPGFGETKKSEPASKLKPARRRAAAETRA